MFHEDTRRKKPTTSTGALNVPEAMGIRPRIAFPFSQEGSRGPSLFGGQARSSEHPLLRLKGVSRLHRQLVVNV
jgi:hypothetical protein